MTVWSSISADPAAGRERLEIPSGGRVEGSLRPPPSKSLTQRAYNLALLAGGRSIIRRPLDSEDCAAFLAGVRTAGAGVVVNGDEVAIEAPRAVDEGRAGTRETTIDCGASGTMMRLLTAALTVLPGRWRVTGAPRLLERPQAELLEALTSLGARVERADGSRHGPVVIEGGTLTGGHTRISARRSSQFVSALLMAGAATDEGLELTVEGLTSAPYVELTLEMLGRFGVEAGRTATGFVVAPQRPRGSTIEIEADASAACYVAAAAALTGGTVRVVGLRAGSRQGDIDFFHLLERMGARVHWAGSEVSVSGAVLGAIDADLSAMPDQVPTLAALAPFARGRTVIRGVPHLRWKESDRLAAMAGELRRLGAPVEERTDGLAIDGCWAMDEGAEPPTESVLVETHDDHRIAMSLAVVGLRRTGLVLDRPAVVAKSYPGFWRDLASVVVL